jgi:hypothetical protein
MSPLFLCFPLVSAGSIGVQPAAEPQHLQRHNHATHVFCALLACPCQQPLHLGPPCALLTPPPLLHALPLPWPACHPSSYAFLSTRQGASAFNQPLSLDTSSVTTMEYMFAVHFSRAPCQQPPHLGPPCALLTPPPPLHALPLPTPACHPSSYAFLSTRQGASAFNQPLSLDTSSVTNMGNMFWVRFSRAPASSLHSWVLPARCLRCDRLFPHASKHLHLHMQQHLHLHLHLHL